MPWVVGIDEAGYGPNLGPLLQAAVSVRLPESDPAGWEVLAPLVRRVHDTDDGRATLDDSKKVYNGSEGLRGLAAGVHGWFGETWPTWVAGLNSTALAGVMEDLRGECWFEESIADGEAHPAILLESLGILRGPAFVNLVPAPRFNRIVAKSGSKATVLIDGLIAFLREMHRALPTGEAMIVHADKQGGRHFYGPLLQEAFSEGFVTAEREGPAESRYRVLELSRPVIVRFTPGADGSSLAVAVASMVCKYLREVCMEQFNCFWGQRVPGLKPTAGYPSDAKRFFDAIREPMAKIGLTEADVWRVK